MLDTRSLTKTFGDEIAVNDIDLTVQPGKILAITRPSRAGKSTLCRMLSFVETATTGSFSLAGEDLTRSQ